MEKEKPIVVNMADGQQVLTILQGQAPQQLDQLAPLKTDITGSIDTPLRWLEKRVNDIGQHQATIAVNRDQLTITLVINESDPYTAGKVCGVLKLSKIFTDLGINAGKQWVPETLGQFLKLHRAYFVSRDENGEVVNALKSLEAKVNQNVQRETKENGNRAYTFRQAVESNIPESFRLNIPIFSGSEPVEIVVETYASIDGSDITITLLSAAANDAMEDVRQNYIDQIVADIQKVAPEIVIYNK